MQVIIPALNEERGIAYTISELKVYLSNPHILVIDGKSSDNTVHVAKSLGADVVFQKGTGKGDALNFGLRCIDADAEYVVISDADFTYPAEHIPKMVRVLDEDPKVGMVCGNRFNSEFPLKAMNNVFFLGNRFIAKAHMILNGIVLNDPLTGLRVIRAELLRGWNPISKDFDIEVELNNYVGNNGFSIKEVPIAYRPRIGQKKLKMKHGLIILKRMLSESYRYNQNRIIKI
jgi:glycosyltransferase involved in cell wall biosynthesis